MHIKTDINRINNIFRYLIEITIKRRKLTYISIYILPYKYYNKTYLEPPAYKNQVINFFVCNYFHILNGCRCACSYSVFTSFSHITPTLLTF